MNDSACLATLMIVSQNCHVSKLKTPIVMHKNIIAISVFLYNIKKYV